MPSYLNQAGTSWPKPCAVVDACDQALERHCDSWDEQFANGLHQLTEFFGVSEEDTLLLTPGCTSSLSVAVADIDWQPGDVIVTSSLEHHALHRPLLKVVESSRQWSAPVDLIVVPPTISDAFDLSRLKSVLQERQVKLVAITAASNVTGDILPFEETARLAREHGAHCLVDGAQVVGWLDVNLSESNIDLFAFGGHKGLHAPWGIGGLFMSSRISMQTPRATCAIGASRDKSDARSCGKPSYCDVGSVDRIALAGLSAAITWLQDQPDRLSVARRRAGKLWSVLESLPGTILYGGPIGKRLPTVAFTHRHVRVAEIDKHLRRHGVVGSAGLQCAPMAHEILGSAPEGVMRLSVGPMNTDDDIDRACEALQALPI